RLAGRREDSRRRIGHIRVTERGREPGGGSGRRLSSMRNLGSQRYTRSEILAAGAALALAGTAGRLFRGLVRVDPAHAAVGVGVQRSCPRRALQPAVVTGLRRTDAASPGLVFVAPSSGPGQRGAMIFDDAGRLVWFHRVPHKTTVTDFKVQQYHGKPVLTWWEGKVVAGLGRGEWVVAD